MTPRTRVAVLAAAGLPSLAFVHSLLLPAAAAAAPHSALAHLGAAAVDLSVVAGA